MSYWKRLLSTITGRARHRLPDQLALLGAPPRLVEDVRRMPEEQQEAAFVAFVDGKHACMLDWRAQRDDVFAELAPLLTPEETRLLPEQNQCPENASGAITVLRRAISPAGRTLIRTESLGDFSFLILVPAASEREFVRTAGPWLIAD